jgi:hypothetical protein
MVKYTFKKNQTFSDRPTPETDKAWDDLLPPGRGFVFVEDWKTYDMPEGEDTPWGMIYSVALFHQMHCLGQLRRFIWLFLDAIVKKDQEAQASIIKLFHEGNHGDHIYHCFDYLRQTIQCGGDMTMEWPRTEADGRRFAVDGWDIPHECKNWVSSKFGHEHRRKIELTKIQDMIMEYMDKKHFNNSMNAKIAPIDEVDHTKLLDGAS